jgi:hypothetical protein
VLITSEAFYLRKIEPSRKEFTSLKHVFLIDCTDNPPAGTIDLAAAMATASDSFETVWTGPEDMALLHFTSGTTGRPKSAVHVHQFVVAHHVTGKLALDLHPDDVFWCTADPGWVTGTSYGIISSLTNGATLIVDQAEFDAERWYQILEAQRTQCLVHSSHCYPNADESWGQHRQAVRFVEFAVHGQRRRTAQPRGCRLGGRSIRKTVPRQLVADRDGWDHDRQLPIDGRQAGIDGQAAAGSDSRCCRAEPQRRNSGDHEADGHGGACAAARLTVDDARLS